MKASRVLIVIGVLLILIQIVSIIGMSNVRVGLYPANDDLLYPHYSSGEMKLNDKILTFAIEAGSDRFRSSFGDFAYDKYDYNDYRVMTPTQIASAMIRESLNEPDLIIYDVLLTISFSFVGISGIVFLIIFFGGNFFAKQKAKTNYTYLKNIGISEDIILTCIHYASHDAPLKSYLDSCVKRDLITTEQSEILFNSYKSK